MPLYPSSPLFHDDAALRILWRYWCSIAGRSLRISFGTVSCVSILSSTRITQLFLLRIMCGRTRSRLMGSLMNRRISPKLRYAGFILCLVLVIMPSTLEMIIVLAVRLTVSSRLLIHLIVGTTLGLWRAILGCASLDCCETFIGVSRRVCHLFLSCLCFFPKISCAQDIGPLG